MRRRSSPVSSTKTEEADVHDLHKRNKKKAKRNNHSSGLLFILLFAVLLLIIIIICSKHKLQQSGHHHHRVLNLNNSNNKPFLVIHVGPPKTGTSTLRDSFRRFNLDGIFAQDGYEYNTPFVTDNVMDFRCHRELLELRQSIQSKFGKNTTTTITEMTLKRSVPCWNKALNNLDEYRELNGTHLLASNETWSFDIHTAGRTDTTNGGQYLMVDWESIQQTIMPKWNLLIVITYRRYPEWKYSAFNQMNKYKTTKPKLQLWPDEGIGGRIIEPMAIPMTREDMIPISFRYTDDLKREMDMHPYIPYAILNMHSGRGDDVDGGGDGLISSFLCDILPKADHSCQYSRKMEKDESTAERVLNPSSDHPLFYDALAIAAYEAGLINGTLYKRPEVADIIQHHHMVTLNMSSSFDLPLTCPTQSQYDGMLNLSLSLEKELVPQFANLPSTEVEHRSSFWKQVETKKFCWIDTESVLKDATWLEFFVRFR